MHLKALFVSFLVISIVHVNGQGVSFSYLIPSDGAFSAPVSPFSVRGIGFSAGPVGLETGASFYNIPGLPMEKIPLNTDKSLVGPHFALLVPGQVTFTIGLGTASFKLMAGGFAFQQLFVKTNEGNLDRALRDHLGWDVANAAVEMENNPGYGWIGGFEFTIPYNREVSLNFGLQYLDGSSGNAITGNVIGGNLNTVIEEQTVNFSEARTRLEGIEISLGASF